MLKQFAKKASSFALACFLTLHNLIDLLPFVCFG
jgi:hypothetical protein